MSTLVFVVKENFRGKANTYIHRADRSYGHVRIPGYETDHTRWHGPFASYESAHAGAVKLGQPNGPFKCRRGCF